jgi:hypothetical protein
MRRMLVLAALALAGCGVAPRLAAAPAPTPSGTLYLAGREPGTMTVVDAAAQTATAHTVPQLTGGDPPYFLAFTGRRLVTFGLGEATSFAPDLSDPRSLGESWFFVPSATPGRVWNILLEPRTNVRFRGVREVTVDGTTTFERLTPVPGWPLGAVDGGLLVQLHSHLAVWSPVTGKRTRVPGTFLLGVRHDLVAACPQDCKAVHFTDGRVVRGPFGTADQGVFSPDGKRLAVAGRSGRIVVVEGNRWRYVPHAHTGAYPALAWASSGWLFYGASNHRVGAWRPGQPARVLHVPVAKFVSMVTD